MADTNIDELNKLHTEFKAAMDRRDEAATQRLNDAISDLEGKMRDMERVANRPMAQDGESTQDAEFKTAFVSYMRTGDKNILREFKGAYEFKSMSASVAGDGGYTVPKIIDQQIRALSQDISPIRQVADVIQVTTPDFHMPFSTSIGGAGTNSLWVGEKDARNPTNTDTLVEIVPTFGELFAKPLVTQTLLEDSQFDIAGFVAGRVAIEFARAEGAAFINGDGNKKPTGLLTPTLVATGDATRAFGSVQYVPTGAAANFAASNPADCLIALVHSLKAAYRANAKFILNKAVLGVLRSFKDQYGQYLWQPSVQAGVPSTLLGYPVVEAEDMPGIAANTTPIAFGDFKQSYVIADRVGMSMMVDPYTQQPYVAYGTRKRVGGTPVNTEAYKLLKVAAS